MATPGLFWGFPKGEEGQRTGRLMDVCRLWLLPKGLLATAMSPFLLKQHGRWLEDWAAILVADLLLSGML